MQFSAACIALAAVATGHTVVALVARDQPRTMATTRVVHLLEGMAKQVQKDADKEEQLFNKYRCWAKQIIESKEATNVASTSRKEALDAHITSLADDTLQLTSEKTDLVKEVADHKASVESTQRARDAQAKTCETNEKDLAATIKALTNAIQVLQNAEAPAEQSKMILLKSRRVESQALSGFAVRAAEADSLSRAVELGATVLDRQDESFLRRVLTGEVPSDPLDMTKLKDAAQVRGSYQGRAKKIVAILEALKSKTELHADDVVKACSAGEKELQGVIDQNKNLLAASLQAQTDSTRETAARDLSKGSAVEQINGLTSQIEADAGFIEQTKTALTAKEEEWEARKIVRADELVAISKAVEILSADEARDTFKESFESQNKGVAFMQLASSQHAAFAAAKAAAVLTSVGRHARDSRASALALMATAGEANSNFTEVLTAIDTLLVDLEKDDVADKESKENCEEERADNTAEAITQARKMDEFSDTMSARRADIADCTAEIAVQNAAIETFTAKQKDADNLRVEEEAQHEVENSNDFSAKQTVEDAIKELKVFYDQAAMGFIQGAGRHGQAAVGAVGQAPPPPPATWDATYRGKAGESKGVLAILNMIATDINADMLAGEKSEKDAKQAYDTFKAANNKAIDAANVAVVAQLALKATAEGKNAEDLGLKNGKNTELGVRLAGIKETTPGCDATTINYPVRKLNRATEKDGLRKAKTILQGGTFEKDPDAFSQMQSNGFLSHVRAH